MAKSLDIIDPKRELEDEDKTPSPIPRKIEFKDQSQGGIFYLVLGILALAVATAAALYILYSDSSSSKSPEDSTASLATVTAEASTTVAGTITPEQTASALPTNQFSYLNEQIRIVNGNGISGEAAKIKKLLEDKGFSIASTGNASKSYSQSVIYYKNGQEALANALKQEIEGNYTATIEEAQSSIVGQYDAVIALGSK